MFQHRKAKRAKFTLHKHGNQDGWSGSHGSLVKLTPKLTYKEVDPSSMYMSTDDESETSRRKAPQTPSGLQAFTFDMEGDQLAAEDGFPTETRTHKVRGGLDHLIVI